MSQISTRVAQNVLQDLLHFSQNQQEMSAVFSPVVNSECPTCYFSATGQFLGHVQGVVMLAWNVVYI